MGSNTETFSRLKEVKEFLISIKQSIQTIKKISNRNKENNYVVRWCEEISNNLTEVKTNTLWLMQEIEDLEPKSIDRFCNIHKKHLGFEDICNDCVRESQ